MKKPVPAYSGHEPFIFVSYSHADTAVVYPEIYRLQEMGFNVWYDEGIDAGDEWTQTLASAIVESVNCIYFVTPTSVRSEHCRREVSFAQSREKPVIAIHLIPTELPDGLQLALGHRQAILKHSLTVAKYEQKLELVLQLPFTRTISSKGRLSGKSVPGDGRQSILVLPFVNRSRNEDADFFCEGIADDIITALSAVPKLRVIASSAARQIDSGSASLKDLQDMLGVEYVLEGSVQAAGTRLRISVRLPRTETGEVLWADRWDGANDEIFDMQDSIALGVLDALKIELGTAQSQQVVARPIPDVNAYEYFLRARQSIYEWTDEALYKALEYLQRGEDIIGENAHIISARGYVQWQIHNLGQDPEQVRLDAAQVCVDQLFQIDPDSPDGHRLQGLVNIVRQGAIESAVLHLRKALSYNPNDNDALFWLSQVYGLVGRVSSGMALAERLLKLDPLTSLNRGLPAVLAMMDGDAHKAVRLFQICYEDEPDNPVFGRLLGQSLAMSGRIENAVAVLDKVARKNPTIFFATVGAFYARCIEGDESAAAEIATEEFVASARSDPQSSWTLAQGYAFLGKHDETIDWISNAIDLGFWNYPLLAERDSTFARTRDHERFQPLMVNLRDKWIFFDA